MSSVCNSVSVLLPVRNGAKELPALFAALSGQTLQPAEILVADSESTDDSRAVCAAHGARVITVAAADFDHGGTRSMLVQEAQGDIVVFFSQDAVPAHPEALERLTAALSATGGAEAEKIACAYGRQLPKADATVAAAFLRDFNYPPTSQLRSYEDRHRAGLKTAFFSNSFSAWRRQVLIDNGCFRRRLIFGEDTIAVGRLLLAGWKVAYVAEAVVWHSHNYSLWTEFRRSFDIGVLHEREGWLLEAFGGATRIGGSYVRLSLQNILEKRRWWLVVDWFFRNGLKYLGYRCGRSWFRLPGFLCRRMSLNRRWWV